MQLKYEINMLRCIFCGFCEEACPKDAVYLSQQYLQQVLTVKTLLIEEDFINP